jgi:hypothetical protein
MSYTTYRLFSLSFAGSPNYKLENIRCSGLTIGTSLPNQPSISNQFIKHRQFSSCPYFDRNSVIQTQNGHDLLRLDAQEAMIPGHGHKVFAL